LKKHIYVGVILLLSLFVLTGFSMDHIRGLENEYADMNENEMILALSKKSITQIFDEVNTISSEGNDLSSLILHGLTIIERIDEISNQELLELIKNESNSTNLRVILVQALQQKNRDVRVWDSNIEFEILKLLQNKSVDNEIRENMIWLLSDNNASNLKALENIVLNEDDRLAFQALKQLRFINPHKANLLAEQILSMYDVDRKQTDKLRAAIKTKVILLRNNGSLEDKSRIVELCIELFENPHIEQMKDTAIFALSEIKHEKSIVYIINSKEIENHIKAFCIDQNFTTLTSMLYDNPTEKNIETLIEAMNIYPIVDLIEPLKDKINASNNAFKISELKEQKGYPVNEKWLNY